MTRKYQHKLKFLTKHGFEVVSRNNKGVLLVCPHMKGNLLIKKTCMLDNYGNITWGRL